MISQREKVLKSATNMSSTSKTCSIIVAWAGKKLLLAEMVCDLRPIIGTKQQTPLYLTCYSAKTLNMQ